MFLQKPVSEDITILMKYGNVLNLFRNAGPYNSCCTKTGLLKKATRQDGASVSHASALGTRGARAHVLVYAGKLEEHSASFF